jgi:hypothetical protein
LGHAAGLAGWSRMNTCTPLDFLERWPGSLRPVILPDPSPALPDDCREPLTRFGLPCAIDIHGVDISLEFSGTAVPLAVAWEEALRHGYQLVVDGQAPWTMPQEWGALWHVGHQEYVQGGAWICVEEWTGRLVAVDLDSPEPVYPISASVAHFYTTLAFFLDWSARTDGTASRIRGLRDVLMHQDCIPADELEPFWLTEVVDNSLDRGVEELTFSLRAC